MKEMRLYSALFIFAGMSYGPFFLSRFGEIMHQIGFSLSILSFLIIGLLYYGLMQMIADLSALKCGGSLHDIVYALLPKYAPFFSWAYVMLCIGILNIYFRILVSLWQDFGMPSWCSSIILFGLSLGSMSYKHWLIHFSTWANFLKLFLLSSFLIVAFSVLSLKGIPHYISPTYVWTGLFSGLAFAGSAYMGIENIIHAKTDMNPKTHRQAIRFLPIIVIFLYIGTIFGAYITLAPTEWKSNLMLYLFKQKIQLNALYYAVYCIMIIGSVFTFQYIAARLLCRLYPRYFSSFSDKGEPLPIMLGIMSLIFLLFFFPRQFLVKFYEILSIVMLIHYPILHLMMRKKNTLSMIILLAFISIFIGSVFNL